MDPNEVKRRLATILRNVYDDEAAHGEEDALYFDVLAAIAHGTCKKPDECARLALTSKKMRFHRWCS